jgi:hypothetical protein
MKSGLAKLLPAALVAVSSPVLSLGPQAPAGSGPTSAPNVLTPQEAAAGWQLLFDGKTLRGWDDPGSRNPPGDAWTVEDGCLKARAQPRLVEDLLTRDTFRDFELSFEWRISPGGNSGVKYRIQDRVFMDASKLKPGATRFEDMVDYEILHRPSSRAAVAPDGKGGEYVIGFEYQVIDNSLHPDAQRGSRYQAGALYDLAPAASDASRPPGEYNQARVVVRANRVEHWLNGVKVVEAMLGSDELAQPLARRWTTASPVYKMLSRPARQDCPIGLQNHGDDAWFRNIKIRRLDAR